MATGTAVLDFGTGATNASVAVTGQTGILATSRVDAWIEATATANHSVEEHAAAGVDIRAGNLVAGTGFTIYGVTRDLLQFKTYTIGWAWL